MDDVLQRKKLKITIEFVDEHDKPVTVRFENEAQTKRFLEKLYELQEVVNQTKFHRRSNP